MERKASDVDADERRERWVSTSVSRNQVAITVADDIVDRVRADRGTLRRRAIIDGELAVDLSTLTGESLPAHRSADQLDTTGPKIEAHCLPANYC